MQKRCKFAKSALLMDNICIAHMRVYMRVYIFDECIAGSMRSMLKHADGQRLNALWK